MEQELIEPGTALVQIHKMELDTAIGTARAYPRPSVARIGDQIMKYATESEAVAQECVYALKRGGKTIIGPTVRFAEIVASSWGNSEFGAQVIDETETMIIARGVFRDLEVNNRWTFDVPRRIVDSDGKRYNIDMIGVTSNAAMSIALRNAVLKGVPRFVWGAAFSKCLALIEGTFETIEKRRTAALDAFRKMGVEHDLVLAMLELKKIDEIEPEDLIVLRGTLQAIKDGDTTVNAVFGAVEKQKRGAAKADVAGQLDKGKEKAGGKGKAAAAAKPAEQGTTAGSENVGGGKTDDGGTGTGPRAAGAERRGVQEGAADGDGAAATGDAGDGGGAAAKHEPVEVAERWKPFLEGDWTEPELAKLKGLAVALEGATTTEQVGKASSEALPVFETSRPELEQRFTKMVAEAQKALRGKSAASKL